MICTDQQILLFTDLRRNSAPATNCDSRYGKQHFGVSLRFVIFVMFINCKLHNMWNASKPSVCPIPIENDSNILSSHWNALLYSTLCDATRRPIVGNVQSAKMGFVTLLRYHLFDRVHFPQSYLEGSHLSGPLFWDTVWLGGNIPTSAHVPLGDSVSFSSYGVYHQFGCFTMSGGLFKSQLADGIIGLAPRGRFPRFPAPPEMSFIGSFRKHIETLRAANPESRIDAMFGFCFIEGGGFMTLGGMDATAPLRPLCWTAFSSMDRYFRVYTTGVFFGAQRAFQDLGKWNS